MTKKEKTNVITIGFIFFAYILYYYFFIVLIVAGIAIIAIAFIYKFIDLENEPQDLIARFHSDSKRNKPSQNLHIKKSTINGTNDIGDLGEQEISEKLKSYTKKFLLIEDIILKIDDRTTQIDHILINRYGIFVIETKNFSGWIFGNSNNKKWTQSLSSGEKYSFQNPIHQNFLHLKALQKLSGLKEEYFHNVVVFTCKSTFKTKLPKFVIHSNELLDYIESFNKVLLNDNEMNDFYEEIKYKYRITNTKENIEKHISNLNEFHKRSNYENN